MTLTITFKLGTDVDKAQVQVQNRVSQALPKLPQKCNTWVWSRTSHRRTSRSRLFVYSPNNRYDPNLSREFRRAAHQG